MRKHVWICDKCGKEEPCNNLAREEEYNYSNNWFNILGKDYCEKCSKPILKKLKEIM